MIFNREVYFDKVRYSPFGGSLDQKQVEGQEAILGVFEQLTVLFPAIVPDVRWLAYMLATTFHETSQEVQPIEEYGKGEGQSYGKKDPETGQTYYGRGFVQLTWRDNYERADRELSYSDSDSLEWHAENALIPKVAAQVMFIGMYQGWFRTHDDGGPEDLIRYFSLDADDPYEAREIINGDKTKVPSWSNGVSIGNLIKGYHYSFLSALQAAAQIPEKPAEPPPEPDAAHIVAISIITPKGVDVSIKLNGETYGQG